MGLPHAWYLQPHHRSGLTENCGVEESEPIPWDGFSNVTVFLIEHQIYMASHLLKIILFLCSSFNILAD